MLCLLACTCVIAVSSIQKHSQLFDQFLQNAHLRQISVLHQDPVNVDVKERRVLEEALQETASLFLHHDDNEELWDEEFESSSAIQKEGSSSEGEEQIMLEQATTTVREKKRLLR